VLGPCGVDRPGTVAIAFGGVMHELFEKGNHVSLRTHCGKCHEEK
jgi:hypothetical protein